MKSRLWFKKLHLWLAFLASIPLLVISLSGALLVYMDPLDELLNRQLLVVEPSDEALPFETIYQAAQSLLPDIKFEGVYPSEHRHRATEVWYKTQEDEWVGLYMNPYTAELLGIRHWNGISWSNLVPFTIRIHYSLLTGEIGRYIVGTASLILLVSILSGLFLWLPRSLASVSQKLKLKIYKRWRQSSYTLHSNLGFYLSPAIFLIALTGVTWTFSGPVRGILDWMTRSPSEERTVPKIVIEPMQAMKNLDELMQGAINYVAQHTELPYVVQSLRFADSQDHAVTVNFRNPSGVYRIQIHINPYTAEVVNSLFPEDQTTTSRILAWTGVLHYGTWGDMISGWFGQVTRVIWLLAALMPSFLIVTGFTIWRKPKWFKQWWGSKKTNLLKQNPLPVSTAARNQESLKNLS